MPNDSMDLLRGTLDMILLRVLDAGPRHGYGLADWIHRTTDEALRVDDGALYTALHRMQSRGLVRSSWGVTEAGRRAKYYEITAAGRKELARGRSAWEAYIAAVGKIFDAGVEGA